MQSREPGQVLSGKYRLIRLLGQGGMGSVWHAHHLTLNAPVALKFIESEEHDVAALQRFLAEARVAAALRSPHVVQILDYGVDEQTPHFAMELLEGETLATRLKRLGPLGLEPTLRVVQQVARAITRAHDAGVIHRDLKPANVFIVRNDDEELIKVLDFGIAKCTAAWLTDSAAVATRTGATLGTPSYMSPEQLDADQSIDARADIWALGVVAYECLLGKLPFVGNNLPQVALSICARPLPVPSLHGAVPPGFDAWFSKACARDREARFSTARRAAIEFAALCAGAARADASRAAVPAVDLTPRSSPEPGPSLVLGTTASATSAEASRPRARRRLRYVFAMLGVLLLGVAGLMVSRSQRPGVAPAAPASPASSASVAPAAPQPEAAPLPPARPSAPAAVRPETAATTAPAGNPGQTAAPGAPVTVEPTVLSEEQKKRDAARVPLATAVTDAFPNWNGVFTTLVASWSPDGKRIVFGSQRDGIPEIYLGEVAAPGAAPKALTSGPESALWARFTGDGKSILFLRDPKGDLNFHIFRVALDGTGLTDLTPSEEMSRGEPLLPRAAPDLMLYAGSRATDPSATLFAQPISGGGPRTVFTNPRPGAALDVTADGKRVLFSDISSIDNMVLLEVDVASGKERRLYPIEGKQASIFTANYSPDGQLAYVTSDEGVESSILVAIDVKTGRQVGRYSNDSPKTAPMYAIVSPKGNRIAVHVDAGNHGEVRILDSETLKVERPVKVPLGFIQLGSFRDDGKAFSLLISVPDRPTDIYEVDVATGSLEPLRQDPRRGLESLPPIEASIAEAKAFDGLTIPINQYLPRDTSAAKKLPTLAIFHGGLAWNYAVRWSNYNRFFSALGYAVIEPNVRGSGGFGRTYDLADNRERRADWLKDVETVNAWAKSQPWCDPDRVVAFGADHGGYTALMALTRQPRLWRAGVDLYGVTDLKSFLRVTDPGVRSIYITEFGDPDQDGALLDEWSPSRDIDKIVAPLFIFAGQNDLWMPRSESDAFVSALRQRKLTVEYMVAPNEGHSIDRRENQIELMTRLARFLEESLGLAPQ